MKVFVVIHSWYVNQEYWDIVSAIAGVFSTNDKAMSYIKDHISGNLITMDYNENIVYYSSNVEVDSDYGPISWYTIQEKIIDEEEAIYENRTDN